MKIQEIEGKNYQINTESLYIQQVDSPWDIIHIDVMKDCGSHYEVLMESLRGTTVIEIPQFVTMDPEGMRQRYSIPENQPLPVKDADFSCNSLLLKARISDQMRPTLEIGSWKYKVDGYAQIFRPQFTIGQWPPFSVHDFQKNEIGFRIIIDPDTGFIIPRQHIPEDKNLIYADIPAMHVLDPVGAAKNENLSPEFYTQRFPVRETITIDKIGRYLKAPYKKLKPLQRLSKSHRGRRR